MAADELETLADEIRFAPDEPFNFRLIGDRLLIAVRCDTGETWAWDCKVARFRSWFDARRASGARSRKGARRG